MRAYTITTHLFMYDCNSYNAIQFIQCRVVTKEHYNIIGLMTWYVGIYGGIISANLRLQHGGTLWLV